ncbi:hypothetical protein BJ912DRAFT_261266 [Pholiota molesta]|nr:hypothetical protein BJ912DRAFT_261266 [Pholiota molesta]
MLQGPLASIIAIIIGEDKCKYCLSSKMKTRDCFFTLQLTNGKTKCTICKHDRKRCEPAEGPQTGEVIPNAGQIQRCALGTTPSTSSGPQASSATPKSSVLKRKATSPVQFSSPFKQRRTEDPSRQPHMQPDVGVVGPNHLITDASIVRQVSRLNTSFQSFNDVSLRQAESRREHDKQEIAFKEKKQAYEESKRVYEESKRTYEESDGPIQRGRSGWLAGRTLREQV